MFVKAIEQPSGEIWAISITVKNIPEVQIDGTIDAYSSSSITVDGVVIAITPDTQFSGTPAVGRTAHVRALQFEDGSLIAQAVAVDEEPTPVPTSTPTLEPTLEPTPTPTLEPTLEPTPTPTLEPTLEPTRTPTTEATATPTALPVPPTE